MLRPFLALCCGLATAPAFAASSTVLPGDLSLQTVASGFSQPVAVRSTGVPGDGRLFVVQQAGAIRIVDNGAVLPTPFLDIGAGGSAPPLGFRNSAGEQGLLGLAFHPDYANNGQFFISYSDGNGDSAVVRYQVSGNPNLANAVGTVILHIDQDFENHNGGDIAFGADGYLYFGLGDGGSGNDPCNRAQTLLIANLATGTQFGENCNPDTNFANNGGDPNSLALLGKLLRVDVDATTTAAGEQCAAGGNGTANYAIPADNPYAGTDGICNEVWHSGLRNPFRFSFDRANGDLFIGDVGQVAREEIDHAPGDVGGLNFGWRCREGDIAGTRSSGCPAPTNFVEPIFAYDRDLGSTVTGGYRYRGPLAALQGVYFYADFGSGRIWGARPYDGSWQNALWQDTALNPSSFGEGSDGALHVVNYGGSLLRFSTTWLFRDGMEPNE
jgi:glucose/arabinose dehydrogenase